VTRECDRGNKRKISFIFENYLLRKEKDPKNSNV
jgi:hypothetical protein